MKPWRISFLGRSWTDTDVTVAHAVHVVELIGDTWENTSPWGGPRVLSAWLSVLTGSASGDIGTATSVVMGMRLVDLLDVLSERGEED